MIDFTRRCNERSRGLIRFLTEPKTVLVFSIAAGVLFVLLHLFFCYSMYRDVANCYAPMIRDFVTGNYADAFPVVIPPLNVFLGGLLGKLGMEPFAAAMAVSGTFYLLTAWPLWLLLRRTFPAAWSALGVFLYIWAPKIIRFGNSGLLESAKIFFLISTIYLVMRLWDKRGKWRDALLTGGALAGLSLARGEGIGNAVTLAGCLGIGMLILWRKKQVSAGRLLGIGLTVFCVWMAVMSPRIVQNYRATGWAVPDARVAYALKSKSQAPADVARTPQPEVKYGVSLGTLISQNLRGGYELYAVFAVAGLLAMLLTRRRREEWRAPDFACWHPEYWLLVAVLLGNMAMHWISIAAYRYFLLNIPLLMVFTVAGMAWCILLVRRWIPDLALIAVALLICVLHAVNGLEYVEGKQREFRAGQWVAENFAPETEVWFAHASPVWFWSGLPRAVPIETEPLKLDVFRDFDLVIMRKQDTEEIAVLSRRSDLEQVMAPPEFSIVLFRPKAER